MKIFRKTKNILLSILTVFCLLSTSTVAMAAEYQPREIETPDSVLQTISELQQDNSNERVVYFPQAYSSLSDSLDIAGYRDRHFFEASAAEPLSLQMYCDTISMVATCVDENQTDELTLDISDITYGGLYDVCLSFPANGDVRTYEWYLPEGLYEVSVRGHSDIEKKEVYIIFSKFL